MIAFETSTRISRPIEEVFAYVSDPLNLPRWNSAVRTVRKTSVGENGVASRYSMERDLPTGRAINQLDVVASVPPHTFAVRATAGPTPFVYRYRFDVENGETVMTLSADVELSGLATVLPMLAKRAVKNGVDANLATLTRILEAVDS